MSKVKTKLSAAAKRAKKLRKAQFKMIFINGKQKWVEREPTVDGISLDSFVAENADPMWLHQNELWELIPDEEPVPAATRPVVSGPVVPGSWDEDAIPF